MSSLAVLLVLGAALSWGTSQTLTKLGLARMDLISYATLRASFGLLFIIPYGLITGTLRFPDLSLVGMAAFAGFIDSFLGTLLYMFAIKRTDAHEAATLSNTAPFWGVVTAVIFLKEPARPVAFIAALLVVIGAYFLIAPSNRKEHSLAGGLSALGAALFWGVAETGPAKYCLIHGMSPAAFQSVLVGSAAFFWWILNATSYRRRAHYYSTAGILNALLTAFTGYFLGWILWLSGLKLAEASLLTPIRGGTMTLFAFGLSVVILHERPSPRAFVGAAIACTGVVLVSILA